MITQNLSLPILDPASLDAIRALDDAEGDELLNEVVNAYFKSSPELIAQMREGMSMQDPQAVRIAAHTLKSSSANVGASRLGDLCRSVEHAARDGDISCGAQTVESIAACYQQTCEALAGIVKQAANA